MALAAGFAAMAATWASGLALRFKTQSAAPLMQASMFILILFTPSYAPQELLTGFLQDAARWNPVSDVVEAMRVTWAGTWPALVVLAGLGAAFGAFALRGIARTGI